MKELGAENHRQGELENIERQLTYCCFFSFHWDILTITKNTEHLLHVVLKYNAGELPLFLDYNVSSVVAILKVLSSSAWRLENSSTLCLYITTLNSF